MSSRELDIMFAAAACQLVYVVWEATITARGPNATLARCTVEFLADQQTKAWALPQCATVCVDNRVST